MTNKIIQQITEQNKRWQCYNWWAFSYSIKNACIVHLDDGKFASSARCRGKKYLVLTIILHRHASLGNCLLSLAVTMYSNWKITVRDGQDKQKQPDPPRKHLPALEPLFCTISRLEFWHNPLTSRVMSAQAAIRMKNDPPQDINSEIIDGLAIHISPLTFS